LIRRESRRLRLGCAIFLLALWGSIAFVGAQWLEMRQRERAADAVSTAKGFSEYVSLHLLFMDRVLENAREHFAVEGRIPAHASLVRDLGSVRPLLLQIAATDAHGIVVASSLPMDPGLSVADRKHFQVFQADPRERLYVSEAVVGRVSHRMSLQLVRPVLGPEGDFRGVIVASIDPRELQRYFGSAMRSGGSVVIAGRNDGVVRARFEKERITWGQSLRNSLFWSELAASTEGSYEVDAGVIDGASRIVGFHKVADYPLIVAVSSPTPTISFGDVYIVVALGLAMTLGVLLFVRGRLRRLRQQTEVIEQLTKSREREMEANRMKSNFIASMSHELRTPLNSILGFSELLRDLPDHPENVRRAGLIHTSGQHLLALLNTILDLAKIEAGRMEVHRAETDLGKTLATVVDVHRASAEAKGLAMRLESAFPKGQSAFAFTDATKYTQVLNNIVNNAVKFTAHGHVAIVARLEDRDFVAEVRDSGCGIAPEQLPYVFERFSRASSPGTRQEVGSGLGLSLSHELMELLGGSIEVSSAPGQGTTVVVRLTNIELRNH
jgi:signal transduction histidine kinase